MNSFMSIDGGQMQLFFCLREQVGDCTCSELLHLKKKGAPFGCGCDYVIHQGSTMKEEEEVVGGWVCVQREAWKIITLALMVIV